MLEAVETLKAMGLPVAPVGLRSRAIYQQAVARGLTAQEAQTSSAAAREIGLLWEHLDASLFSNRVAARRIVARPRLQPTYAAMAMGAAGAQAAGQGIAAAE